VTEREIPLIGGDMSDVVRVGDTVRRPVGSLGVQALLRWYERVGFDGAPRFIGIDQRGREILSFVEGEPGFAPVPGDDGVVAAIGRLLRRAHDAQAGFVPPPNAGWERHDPDTAIGEWRARLRGRSSRQTCAGSKLTVRNSLRS
jgi:hypothetical protein